MNMTYEGFEYFYPMPDDIAQSILIAETETDVHLRPTNPNAKKICLYNKLLKNLLTNRKTIISIESELDAQILGDFLKEHELEPLAFFFAHSRSTNENNLKNFAPLIVNGKIVTKEFYDSLKNLKEKHYELTLCLKAIYNENQGSKEDLLMLLQRSIQLNTEINPYNGFQSNQSNLSWKEYINLKSQLDQAIELSKGGDVSLQPLNELHSNIFEMFESEEAWQCIEHHFVELKSRILELLELIHNITNKKIENFIIQVQSSIIPVYFELLKLKSLDQLSSEDKIQFSISEQKFKILLKELLIDQSSEDPDFFLNLSIQQINLIIYEAAYTQIIDKNSTEFLRKQDSIHKEVNLQLELFNHFIRQSGILQFTPLENTPIEDVKAKLVHLLQRLNLILKLKQYFHLFFDWKKFLLGCTKQQQQFITEIASTPTTLWYKFLELDQIHRQIRQFNLNFVEKYENSYFSYLEAFQDYKSKLVPFIKGKYESFQQNAITKLCSVSPEFNQLLINHEHTSFNLQDYYNKIQLLCELFPILIIDNGKEEYFPLLNIKIWDEFICMNETISLGLNDKLTAGSQRRISLHNAYSQESSFNIALMQSPPLVLKDILISAHHSESFSLIKQLSNFLFSNQSKLIVLLNSHELVISFMSLEITKLMAQFNGQDYNLFQINEEHDFERLTEWLMYKSTSKKIWTMDHLINVNQHRIQQIGWQTKFLQCLQLAGFSHENFSSQILFAVSPYLIITSHQQLFHKTEKRLSYLNTEDYQS